jgi:thiamine-monophosphate kinase
VIDSGGKVYRLFTTDCLVESVHFKRGYVPLYYAGRKAIKVNLSDIASMGGTPDYFLVSIGAPPDTPVQLIDELYDGMSSVARECDVKLIGGNITAAPQLFIDITMMGSVSKKRTLRRDGARRGDSIFVTGSMGASAEGLNLLQDGFRLLGNGLILPNGQRDSHLVMEAILRHIDPPCLVDVARKLAATSQITSMIDLSDGLSGDLQEVCRESGVGARIELKWLPIDPCVLYWERKRNRDPRILALEGGEDYHLLFTVGKKSRDAFLRRMKSMKITTYEIGHIVSRSEGIYAVDEEGNSRPLGGGYQHFH